MKILVTGAAGQLGTTVVRHLLKNTTADQIAVLVRDANKVADLKEKGVAVHVGDYDDVASLENAMQGIEKVLLIAGTDEQKRVQQHTNVVNAAKKAGVKLIAYTSRCLKNRDTLVNKLMIGHFQTEDCIMESGLTYMLFRNILYMDTIPNFVSDKVFETGINLPVSDGKVSFCLRKDIEPVILEQWMGLKVIKLDNSNHGSFEFETIREGKVVFKANGTIHKITPNQKIIRTFEMDNLLVGVRLEFLDFERITDKTSKLTMQMIYQSEKHRAEQLKLPFSNGLNTAHDRLQNILTNLK